MTDQSDSQREPISLAVAILAAGKSTRMDSSLPKHVHTVGGVPILKRIVRAAQGIQPEVIGVVLSSEWEHMPAYLGMEGEFVPIVTTEATGTGSAVLAAIEALPPVDYVVSLLGDSPLLTTQIIQELVDESMSEGLLVTVLSCVVDDAGSYGRIDRDDDGNFTSIIEQKNDEASKRVGPTEINSGIMVLKRDWALEQLRVLPRDPQKNEYLLTDLIKIAVAGMQPGEPWPVHAHKGVEEVSVGVNTRHELAAAERKVHASMRDTLKREGVSLIGEDTIFVDDTVTVGRDTVIHPGSVISGDTRIGEHCVIGPYAIITNATIGNGVTVRNSTVEDSTIADGSDVGPYAHLRGQSVVGEHVHIGNYAELKNARLDRDVKVGHFSYLGDVHIGERTNIGAGTITANFDGVRKNHTEIAADTFIGSDTILVAPVEVEAGGRTGAGSVVTKPVKAGQTVVGIPARPIASRSQE